MHKTIVKMNMDKCTGCSLCVQICPTQAIHMQYDREGFSAPVIDKKVCIGCDKCLSSCPNGTLSKVELVKQQVYACQAINSDLLIESTAGGFFSVLSKYVLSIGGVVFGAAYDKNMNVIHQVATDMEGVKAFNGSKYVQSDITKALGEVKMYLQEDRYVLFSGTPCQIDAVNRVGNDLNTNRLLTMDVVCYGVPSPGLFRSYLDTEEKKHNSRVIDFRFRDKHENGWSHTTVITFERKNKTRYVLTEPNYERVPYYKMFGNRDCFRKSCYQCKYNSLQRVSDITTGNFWGIDEISKKFDSHLGVSMVITNTEKGMKSFSSIQKELICEIHTVEEAVLANPALVKGTPKPKNRNAIYRYYQKKGFEKMIKRYYSDNIYYFVRKKMSMFKHQIKVFLGGGR